MSAGEETEDAPEAERPYSVQDMQADLIRHVFTLAKAGVFAKRQAAQAVLTYYAFNTARYDSEPRGFRSGFVMPGCTHPAAVARATSLGREAVRLANTWLHEQRLIEITNAGTSIKMLPHGQDEKIRQKFLTEEGTAPAPELRRGPRPRKAAKSTTEPDGKDESEAGRTGHCDLFEEVITTQWETNAHSVGNTEPDNSHSVGTYSSRSSSSYIPDSYRPEHAQARASLEVTKEYQEEEKRAPASPGGAGQPATVPARSEAAQPEGPSTGLGDTSQPAGNRPSRDDVQEVYRDLVASVIEAYATQNGVSSASAEQYLASGLKRARNLAARVNYLTSVMEDLAIADDKRLDILEDYARPSSAPSPRGAAPAAAPSQPARAERATTYDNRFRFGVAKDGVPYFSRGGKPLRTDEGSATLTQEEAVEYFRLHGTDTAAWIKFKHELYERYRAA